MTSFGGNGGPSTTSGSPSGPSRQGYRPSKYRYSDEVDEDEQPLLLHTSPSFSGSAGSEGTRGNNNNDHLVGEAIRHFKSKRIPILAAIETLG